MPANLNGSPPVAFNPQFAPLAPIVSHISLSTKYFYEVFLTS